MDVCSFSELSQSVTSIIIVKGREWGRCLLFIYVYERSMRLYGYFQDLLKHPYWMLGIH